MLPTVESITARLHLRHFRLLVAIDEQGSLVKAAEAVAITQPGATKSLQEIEAAVGAELFVRTNRGIRPNDLGRCVIRYARLINQDLALLRDDMAGIMQGRGGRLTVGTIMGAVPLLTEHLSRFLEKQPSIRVELVEDTSARLLSLLDNGRLDLAICRTSVSPRPELYHAEPIREEQLAVVANVAHPLANQPADLKDLADCTWIVYAANMPMRRYLEQEFSGRDIRFPTRLIETTSAFATLSLLQRNPSFVALLSTEVASVLSRTSSTTVLGVDLPSRSEPYFLVTRPDRSLSPSAALFRREVC